MSDVSLNLGVYTLFNQENKKQFSKEVLHWRL